MKTPELMALLKNRLEPAFLVLGEVTVGWGTRADAIAVGLWASRGRTIDGYELKVDRRDWLRELANPGKAEAAWSYCDHWWLVAGDSTIVRPEELPPSWGLLVARGSKLHIATKAPTLSPKPIDRALLVSLLRRGATERDQGLQRMAERNAEDLGYKKGYADGKKDARREAGRQADRDIEMWEAVERFQRASGVRIREPWQAGDIGAAVRWLTDGYQGGTAIARRLSNVRDAAEAIIAIIDQTPDLSKPPVQDDEGQLG